MRQHPTLCRAAEQREIIADFQGRPWLDSGLVSRPIAPIDSQLARLSVPTLLINGEHDLQDFIQVSDDLTSLLANCRRVTIKDGGGFPLWEFPERVNAEVSDFLERLDGPR